MKLFYGSSVWLIVTAYVTYAFCLNTAAAVFADSVKISLHLTDTSTTIAMGSFILGFALMQIPAGYLLDKYSARIIVNVGIFLLAMGNFLISYAHNLILFTIANFIQGVGGSFAFIAAALLISQWFESNSFPILFGLTQMVSCLLTGVLHYFLVQKLKIMTWSAVYMHLAVIGFCLLILGLLFIKNPNDYKREATISFKSALGSVVDNSQIWICLISTATSLGVLMAYSSFWYQSIQNYYGVSIDDALTISAMIFFGLGIGTPILGWISNLLKSRVNVIHTALALGNIMLILAIYLPHFNTKSLILIKTVSFCVGFFLSGSMLLYTVVNEITSSATRGLAISAVNTGAFLYNTIMMFIPYLFITTSQTTFFTYLWVLPLNIMIAILFVFFIKDSYRKVK